MNYEDFESLKTFVGFTPDDAGHLVELAPVVAAHGPGITDRFYDTLGRFPETARLIEGRVAALKKTHHRYLSEMVAGDYGQNYFTSRVRVGRVHVVQGIPPRFVEAVMSVIRTSMLAGLATTKIDAATLAARAGAFIKLCDIDMVIINSAYNEERLVRFSDFTGMSRGLIENAIRMGAS